MIYENLEFFNVAEINTQPDGSLSLFRFPKSAYMGMSDVGCKMARSCSGIEIRFVTDANVIWFTLGARAEKLNFHVYCGDYKYQSLEIGEGEKKTFFLEPINALASIDEETLNGDDCRNRYSSKVWRIVFSKGFPLFYGVEPLNGTFIRPPKKEELPKKTMLAYGSSISHGCWTDNYTYSYVNIAAEQLGIDVKNKAMSGSCREERAVADFLAKEDFDLAFLELTTNMCNPFDYSLEEVLSRTEYMLRKICEADKSRKIICTNGYRLNYYKKPENYTEYDKRVFDVKNGVDRIVSDLPYENLVYVDSREIYKNTFYACLDLIHPGEFGHYRMAESLRNILSKYM